MTPIAERLNVRLEAEVRQVQDKWLFKWHFIGKDGPVEIDDFRGGTIRYGGIMFDGTARIVFWDTIAFYLRKKIGELFDDVESALQTYPPALRETAIFECQSLISGFAATIKEAAIDKDQVLRGNGFSFPTRDETHHWVGSDAHSIQARADGLRAVYCSAQHQPSRLAKIELSLKEHKELVGLTFVGVGAVFAVVKLFFGF